MQRAVKLILMLVVSIALIDVSLTLISEPDTLLNYLGLFLFIAIFLTNYYLIKNKKV